MPRLTPIKIREALLAAGFDYSTHLLVNWCGGSDVKLFRRLIEGDISSCAELPRHEAWSYADIGQIYRQVTPKACTHRLDTSHRMLFNRIEKRYHEADIDVICTIGMFLKIAEVFLEQMQMEENHHQDNNMARLATTIQQTTEYLGRGETRGE